ncbi:MAG: TRAP transporter substrate-binding protein [Pseudomonadota bacterium]|nr:TRAP transporter substrate-binding protein [Pseudomonadota bacterium]MEE2859695.1 TRAP transporter substrate-binding protein [Pseudomonadota bacterium]
MKRQTRTLSAEAVLGLAAVAAATLGAAPLQAETNLRFASIAGPTAYINTGILEPWFEDITGACNGEISVELLSAASAARPQDVFESVEDGLVDFAWGVMPFSPGRFPEGSVVELPLLANTTAEASPAMWGLYEEGLLSGFDGVKVLSVSSSAMFTFHAAEDLDGLDGMSGLRTRVSGATASEVMKELGATPLGLPIPAVAENLARHTIDAVATDWYAIEGWGIMDLVSAHIDIPLGAAGIYLIMNTGTWDGLSAECQAGVTELSGPAFAKRWGDGLTARSAQTRAALEARGDTIIVPDAAAMEGLRGTFAPVEAAWIEATPNGQSVIDRFRELVAGGAAE